MAFRGKKWRPRQELSVAGSGEKRYDRPMKKFLHTFKKISPGGLMAVRAVLILCCVMAFAGFVLCLFAGEPGVRNHGTYQLAKALGDTPAGVLLIGGIGLIIFEVSQQGR